MVRVGYKVVQESYIKKMLGRKIDEYLHPGCGLDERLGYGDVYSKETILF